MTISEHICLCCIFHFGIVFVFCRLINKNVLEWFLLIMYKEHTLIRSTNLFSRNHPLSCFLLRKEGRQMSNYLLTLWVINLHPHACNFIKKDSGTGVPSEFCKISKNTFFTNTFGRLLLFPYKYVLGLWSLHWLKRIWGSWYLIIWLEIAV